MKDATASVLLLSLLTGCHAKKDTSFYGEVTSQISYAMQTDPACHGITLHREKHEGDGYITTSSTSDGYSFIVAFAPTEKPQQIYGSPWRGERTKDVVHEFCLVVTNPGAKVTEQ
jgi:hypothetical protein